MKTGISTASFYPLETELSLEIIGKSSVKTTELFFNAESELKPSFIDILLEIKEKYGMDIVSVHPTMSLAESFMIFSRYDRRYRESLDIYSRYSEIAAELGAEFIIMHGGKPNGLLSDEEYCERYMALKEATLKNGITVLQENVRNYRSADREFLRSMVNILGDGAEFCFDNKQAIRCGYDPFDLMDEFMPHIKHFHISDHSLASDCMLPFAGKFDFKSFFEKADAFGFKGSAVIEVYSDAYKDYGEVFESYNKLESLYNTI